MNSGKSSKRKQSSRNDQIIDASPDGDSAHMLSQSGRPKNVQETEAWKDGSRRVKKIWSSYIDSLKNSFRRMPRAGQLELITKGSIIVTMGVAVISLTLFYSFLPTIIRVIALPTILIVAWFTAIKLVAPMVKDRLELYMNQE